MSQHVVFLSQATYFDVNEGALISKNKPVALTLKESKVLQYLCENEARTCENELIYAECWDVDDQELERISPEAIHNAVKNLIKRLRNKLAETDEALSEKSKIIQTANRGYRLILPEQINQDKASRRMVLRAEEHTILAMEEYRRFWVEADKLFIENKAARKVKKYFYTDRDDIPSDPGEMELGLAVAEYLRDTISYSEILLGLLPNLANVEDHFHYKKLILNSWLAREGFRQFRFSSEDDQKLNQDTLRYTTPIDVRAVVAASNIFLELDRLFIDYPEVLKLRKYFYDIKHRKLLPENSEALTLGLSVCEYIKDQLQYAEGFLPYIPEEHVDSYMRYKRWILDCAIMEASRAEYAFPWELRRS